MRAFVLILLAAFLNASTLAMAGQPFNPVTTDLPSAINSQLPDLGSPANAMVNRTEQFQIGYGAMLQLRQQHALFEDPETEEYIEQIGQRLASQSTQGGGDFHYLVLKSDEPNSFAVSGGFVFIFTGAISLSHTES